MKLIDYMFIVGPRRSGSTFLYHLLLQVKAFRFPNGEKETFYFQNKVLKESLYLRYFSDSKNKIISESAPYMFDDWELPKRLKEGFNKNIKFIIIYRNENNLYKSTIDHYKAYSNFTNEDELVLKAKENCDYIRNFNNWLKIFPEERFVVINFNYLSNSSSDALKDLMVHLGLEVDTGINYIVKKNIAVVSRNKWVSRTVTLLSIFLKRHNVQILHKIYHYFGIRNFIYRPKSSEENVIENNISPEFTSFLKSHPNIKLIGF